MFKKTQKVFPRLQRSKDPHNRSSKYLHVEKPPVNPVKSLNRTKSMDNVAKDELKNYKLKRRRSSISGSSITSNEPDSKKGSWIKNLERRDSCASTTSSATGFSNIFSIFGKKKGNVFSPKKHRLSISVSDFHIDPSGNVSTKNIKLFIKYRKMSKFFRNFFCSAKFLYNFSFSSFTCCTQLLSSLIWLSVILFLIISSNNLFLLTLKSSFTLNNNEIFQIPINSLKSLTLSTVNADINHEFIAESTKLYYKHYVLNDKIASGLYFTKKSDSAYGILNYQLDNTTILFNQTSESDVFELIDVSNWVSTSIYTENFLLNYDSDDDFSVVNSFFIDNLTYLRVQRRIADVNEWRIGFLLSESFIKSRINSLYLQSFLLLDITSYQVILSSSQNDNTPCIAKYNHSISENYCEFAIQDVVNAYFHVVQCSKHEYCSFVHGVNHVLAMSIGNSRLVMIGIFPLWTIYTSWVIVGVVLSVVTMVISPICVFIMIGIVLKPYVEYEKLLRNVNITNIPSDSAKIVEEKKFLWIKSLLPIEFVRFKCNLMNIFHEINEYKVFLPDHILNNTKEHSSNNNKPSFSRTRSEFSILSSSTTSSGTSSSSSSSSGSSISSTSSNYSYNSSPNLSSKGSSGSLGSVGSSTGSKSSGTRSSIDEAKDFVLQEHSVLYIHFFISRKDSHEDGFTKKIREIFDYIFRQIRSNRGEVYDFGADYIIGDYKCVNNSLFACRTALNVKKKVQNGYLFNYKVNFGISITTSTDKYILSGGIQRKKLVFYGYSLHLSPFLSKNFSLFLVPPEKRNGTIFISESCSDALPTNLVRKFVDYVYLQGFNTLQLVYELVEEIEMKDDEWMYELDRQKKIKRCDFYNSTFMFLRDDPTRLYVIEEDEEENEKKNSKSNIESDENTCSEEDMIDDINPGDDIDGNRNTSTTVIELVDAERREERINDKPLMDIVVERVKKYVLANGDDEVSRDVWRRLERTFVSNESEFKKKKEVLDFKKYFFVLEAKAQDEHVCSFMEKICK